MAKIVVVGQAVVITSAVKFEDIKLIKKYRPEALILYKGEGQEKEPVFKIGVAPVGCGSISKYGVEFESATRDEAKLATLTGVLTQEFEGEELKAFISDEYGPAILLLNELEAQLPAVVEEIAAMKDRIDRNIEIRQ